MNVIYDGNEIERYLKKYEISSCFIHTVTGFFLCFYERGEILNHLFPPEKYLQFFLDGVLKIYSLRSDGSFYPISQGNTRTILGDVEFCRTDNVTQFLAEAGTACTCLVLPLDSCREYLLNDPVFLRTILASLSRKFEMFSVGEADYPTVEKRLLHYLEQECPDGTLRDLEKATFHLHCSRRQLQRVLKSLTGRGILEHPSHGYYRRNRSGFPGRKDSL